MKQDACSAIVPGAHHQRVVKRGELEVLDDGIADHVIKDERHCGHIIVANARIGVVRPSPAGRSACQCGSVLSETACITARARANPLTLTSVGLASVQESKSCTQMVSRSPQITY